MATGLDMIVRTVGAQVADAVPAAVVAGLVRAPARA